MNKYMPILVMMTAVAINASFDVDTAWYQTHIKPQAKDIRKTRASYEKLLRATENYQNNVRNPLYTIKRTKEMPAEITALKTKKRLTDKEQRELRELDYNYQKNIELMNELQNRNWNVEVGQYHPDVTEFIGSYRDKDLGGHQEAIRRKIREHKLSSSLWPATRKSFNGFTARVYNYWFNRY